MRESAMNDPRLNGASLHYYTSSVGTVLLKYAYIIFLLVRTQFGIQGKNWKEMGLNESCDYTCHRCQLELVKAVSYSTSSKT